MRGHLSRLSAFAAVAASLFSTSSNVMPVDMTALVVEPYPFAAPPFMVERGTSRDHGVSRSKYMPAQCPQTRAEQRRAKQLAKIAARKAGA